MSIFGVKFGPGFVPPAERIAKPEKKCENIAELMAHYAEKINKVFEKYANSDEQLVGTDCKLNIQYFSKENNGAYSEDEIATDGELKADLYNQWAAKKYHLTEDTDPGYIMKKVAEYTRRRENSSGEQSEKLLLINLNKILAPEYFVIHASDYDDLANGVDYVVVEAETGVIACGLDAFYDKKEDVESLDELMRDIEHLEKQMGRGEATEHNYQSKLVKLKKISERNGAKIKYGFSINDGEMQNGYMNNMPAFALRLSPSDFKQLQNDMNFVVEGENSQPSETELKIFDGLIRSLEEQSGRIAENPKANPRVIAKLDVFNKTLERIKEIREKVMEII